ncbi:MAG: hypothetical protein Q4E84_05550 [Clostridia bacterium]|nr:hypothetical protein [Clostridia bacterium]
MKSTIPTVTIVLGVTVMTCIAVCIISFQLQITGAREFHANCINSIEASYGSRQVINDCISKADDKGYKLSVTEHGIYDDRPSYKVVLEYNAKALLLNLNQDTKIEGFAR